MNGLTFLANIKGVAMDLLSSEEIIRLLLVRSVEAIGMTPVRQTLQVTHFPMAIKNELRGGFGLSGSLILVESHVSCHTWPEESYMRFELSSCKKFDHEPLIETLKTILGFSVDIDYIVVPWQTEIVSSD